MSDRAEATPNLGAPPDYKEVPGDDGFMAHVGQIYFRRPMDGKPATFGLRADARHINRGGVVHGGMLVSFIDHALGAMVYHAVKGPCSTISLDCNFIAPGRAGEWIECQGEVTRVTKSVVFMRGRLVVGERMLMDAKGIWKVLDKWLGQTRNTTD